MLAILLNIYNIFIWFSRNLRNSSALRYKQNFRHSFLQSLHYGCLTHRKAGKSFCWNDLENNGWNKNVPIDLTDDHLKVHYSLQQDAFRILANYFQVPFRWRSLHFRFTSPFQSAHIQKRQKPSTCLCTLLTTKVMLTRVVAFGSFLFIEMVMAIALFLCENSGVDICSSRNVWFEICKRCCATEWRSKQVVSCSRSSKR